MVVVVVVVLVVVYSNGSSGNGSSGSHSGSSISCTVVLAKIVPTSFLFLFRSLIREKRRRGTCREQMCF